MDPTLLTYLERRLRLIRTVAPEETEVRFELDPLEEYLAALQAMELCGGRDDQWRKFFQRADQMPGAPVQTRGFLLAVRDCCEAKGADWNIPAFVLDELGSRAGLDP